MRAFHHLIRHLVHGVGAQYQQLGASHLEPAGGGPEHGADLIPPALALEGLHLTEIHRVEDAPG